MPKVQLTIILGSIAYFSTLGVDAHAGLSAFYGGTISLTNTLLVERHTRKQREDLTISAQASVGMMTISVIIRMAMVIGLITIGQFVLELNTKALVVSLVLGICGFLIDKVLQK